MAVALILDSPRPNNSLNRSGISLAFTRKTRTLG
jgi:hypothetical protein